MNAALIVSPPFKHLPISLEKPFELALVLARFAPFFRLQ